MNYKIIESFCSYNHRRYSTPWICQMNDDGTYDFSTRVGTYTGNGRKGEAGDLVVFNPQVGKVYAYGQKDYRGGNTVISYARYNGDTFVKCDKLGRDIIN